MPISLAKKSKDPIRGLGDENKLTVQKSLPLLSLWKSDLTLAEFKILDTYLGRIDSHKPEKRTVVFEKGELEDKLGVKKINQKELEERLKHLMGNVVKIPDRDDNKGFRLITLFEEALAEQDENGLWQIKMECTQKAMKFIFNVDNLGYLRYKLRCITALGSRYTYILFLYLEANRKMHMSWEIPLDKLKEILNCDKVKTYSAFKEFNKQILRKAQAELHEKTECHFEYTPIKRGRKVAAIRFDLKSLTPQIEPPVPPISAPSTPPKLPEQVTWEDIDVHEVPTNLMEQIYSNACAPDGEDGHGEFTLEEIRALISLISSLPESKLPSDNDGMGVEFQMEAYLRQKYRQMCAYAAKKPIKHRFSYLKKAIEKDVGIK
jgi:hypothetical protein